MKRLACLGTIGVLLLSGCAGALNWTSPPSDTGALGAPATAESLPTTYQVQPGDTLYSIAWRYGLDYHDVARWNGIGSDYLIKPGQTLRLYAPPGTAAANSAQASVHAQAPAGSAGTGPGSVAPEGKVTWQWPVDGRVIRSFHPGNPLSKGIDISAAQGAQIRAAAAGKVVYAGNGIIGYGKLIIIKDSERFLSAYADNDEMLVREGDSVQAGDLIATMGLNRGGRPMLHFEIRRNGKPVDPLTYLPSRQ